MKKLSSISIKISALIISIASFSLPAQQANAQEIGADSNTNDKTTTSYDYRYQAESTKYFEIYTSFGNAYNADPETWDNNDFYAIGVRFANQDATHIMTNQSDLGGNFGNESYLELEYAETSRVISPIDGLTRKSTYGKIGTGWVYTNTAAPTSSFVEWGLGIITVSHSVEGEAAWQSPASETRSYQKVAYENRGMTFSNNPGIYVHAGYGIRIKNRHKLTFYITPVLEGTLSVRATTYNDEDNSQSESYYGTIPSQIFYGMAGFRYSYIFRSSWEKESRDFRRLKINPPQ